MKHEILCVAVIAACLLAPAAVLSAELPKSYAARGTIQALSREPSTVTVNHEAIAGYMPAMSMPFQIKDPRVFETLAVGDQVSFTLKVTSDESWIEDVTKTGKISPNPATALSDSAPVKKSEHPLLQAPFTNELGQVVRLSDFKGQALAITFFFTRCPIPNFCPRLSKNFQEASRKLLAMPGAPTNWHFLSVSFDTDFDTPPVLKAYGQLYGANPAHWSFLTGRADQIRELAALSDARFEREGGLFNHNFRTLVIDANGRLQMTFPIGGDLSEALVEQILKAAAATDKPT